MYDPSSMAGSVLAARHQRGPGIWIDAFRRVSIWRKNIEKSMVLDSAPLGLAKTRFFRAVFVEIP